MDKTVGRILLQFGQEPTVPGLRTFNTEDPEGSFPVSPLVGPERDRKSEKTARTHAEASVARVEAST